MKYDMGIIGVGEFCLYLVDGFKKRDPEINILLSPRGEKQTKDLAKRYGFRIGENNAAVAAAVPVILLATRPAQVEEALNGIDFNQDQLVISVATGITHEHLNTLVAPAHSVLCMPTNSAMIGVSPVPMYPANDQARRLLKSLGPVFTFSDEKQYEACAVLGAYYGWMLALQAESMDWLSRHNVDPDQARNIIDSVLRATSEIDQYRKQLTTRQLSDELRLPGGVTEFGLKMFEESGSIKDWSKVMDAVLARLSKSY